MPFESDAQRAFMYMHHPDIAKRWSMEYPNQGALPQHVPKHPNVVEALLRRATRR